MRPIPFSNRAERAQRPAVNSHIHLPPNFSAFNSVQQAIDLASQQSVGVLGVSNYYDYDVYGQFVELARKRKSHVPSATKSNGIIHTMPYWDERVEAMAKGLDEISALPDPVGAKTR